MRDNSRELWPMAIMAASAAVIMVAARGFPERWNVTDGEWLGFFGSVLGGLFTVLAAYIAWRSVKPQIVEARKQSAANAKMAMLHQPVDFNEELKTLQEASAIARQLRRCIDGYRHEFVTHYYQVADLSDQCAAQLSDLWEYIERTAVMYPPLHPTYTTRLDLGAKTKELTSLWGLMSVHIDSVIGRRDSDDALKDEDANTLLDNIDEELVGFIRARNAHVLSVTEQLRELWARIRNLEDIAVGSHSAASR